MKRLLSTLCFCGVLATSCKKQNDPAPAPVFKLSYGDSIFYLKDQPNDFIVTPVEAKAGTFTSFPDGLQLDASSGAINVSKSDAGMKYRVTWKSGSGDSSNAFVVISGINFPDKFYRLDRSDSVAFPVYNGDPVKILPTGSSFDDDRVANTGGCAMRTNNGQINLTESIRNGLFGNTPQNNSKKDFDVKYRLNDQSGKASNSIKIQLYYFTSTSDVPADLQQTMLDHQAMTFQPNNQPISSVPLRAAAKPRPPCIVVIAHQ
jgi:hypothetical protein